MKRALGLALALGLLCLAAGCGAGAPAEEETAVPTTTEPLTEITIEQTTTETITQLPFETFSEPLPAVSVAEGYGCTAAYAKTPERVYAVNFSYNDNKGERECYLYTAGLDNLDRAKRIDLPRKYKGKQLYGMKICGVSPQGLYVYFSGGSWVGVVYLVPHDGGKARIIAGGGGFACPWYNAAGHSLLYFLHSGDGWKLEALRLDTGDRALVYDKKRYPNDTSDVWHNLKDGSVALELCDDEGFNGGPCLRIDEKNRAQEEEFGFEDLHYAWAKQMDEYRTSVTCGGWLYCVEGDWSDRNFYRMRPEGTQKKLLRAKTHVYRLEAVNDQLFALASYASEDEDSDVDRIILHRLDADGKVVETIYRGNSGDNGGMDMRQWDGLILVSEFMIGGGHGEWFAAFYDPASGAIFSLTPYEG